MSHLDIKTKLRIFPMLEDMKKMEKIKIDQESLNYITIREMADKITYIIKHKLAELDIKTKDATITDCMAGVGGNTISFAKTFKYANAIENNYKRFKFLQNNLNVYDVKNTATYLNDYLDIYKKLTQNVIFIPLPVVEFVAKQVLMLLKQTLLSIRR